MCYTGVHQFGSSLAASPCWRVAVEVISARDLVPSSRIAQGPGMIQGDKAAGGLAHEVVDGRDCFCEVYFAIPLQQGNPTQVSMSCYHSLEALIRSLRVCTLFADVWLLCMCRQDSDCKGSGCK
jgi:hypothetical protein